MTIKKQFKIRVILDSVYVFSLLVQKFLYDFFVWKREEETGDSNLISPEQLH